MDQFNPTLLIEQATEFYKRGEIQQSIELLQKGTKMYPNWPSPFYNLGIIYKEKKNWELSYKAFEQVLELDDKDIYSWWHF
ncbi:MAG TPA: tetratricopeptide repeat protein [Mucilaginibacter sp.]|jgi:tetratricopeptide (TPR) repeat protein